MSNMDLNSVIEDSLNDLKSEPEVEVDSSDDFSSTPEDTPVEDSPIPESTETADGETTEVEGQVPTPAAAGEAPAAEDEFSKEFGIPSKSVTGRENRIPYSRVKRIVGTAKKNVTEKVTKEVEAKFQPKLTEYETKIADYETKLKSNHELTTLIDQNPRDFLGVLQRHPAYKGFFDFLEANLPKEGSTPKANGPAPGAEDPMPQPNKKAADGSLFYDMDGVKDLMDWQARQTTRQVTGQIDQQYGPIRKEWEAQQKINEMAPIVEKQLADAKQWPNFSELEDEIGQLLEADDKLSLEGAYRVAYHKNIVPKLQAQNNPEEIRAKTRAEVIAELKAKGSSPSVRSTPTSPKVSQSTGVRSLEDIIAGEVEKIK